MYPTKPFKHSFLLHPSPTPARCFAANPFLPIIFSIRLTIFPMRIRGGKQIPAADCSALSRSTSSWSSSSSSSSSSITATHSLASSQDSSNSSPFSLMTASSRCPGLDLLVKAIHQITAGSVVGVPYIQRRVTIRRRRRRMSSLDGFIHAGIVREKGLQDEKKTWTSTKKTNKKKIGRRTVYHMGSPTRTKNPSSVPVFPDVAPRTRNAANDTLFSDSSSGQTITYFSSSTTTSTTYSALSSILVSSSSLHGS